MIYTKETSNGPARLLYRVGGSGPAICLIASTGRGGRDFTSLTEELIKQGFKVIVPEPRSVGGSTGTLNGINFHVLATDVQCVIENEVDHAMVAGHAYGCWIARTVAALYPESTSSIVLMAAGAYHWPQALSTAIDCLANPDSAREQRLAALRLAFFAPTGNPEHWLDGWHLPLLQAQRKARLATDRESWWHSGSAPILDLIALQDPFRPEESWQQYAEEFGERVTVRFVDNASHALPDEQAANVAQQLADWALRVGPR